ncbi:E3 ubiquitin-protein ligase SINA-like protein 3 [Hordeum vulgare]|nr:E3 ubiquitin-protein ligase SINA-like protein 3 [Hordeum vulgare]
MAGTRNNSGAECSFEGLPKDLVRHPTVKVKSDRHAWTTHKFMYCNIYLYAIDALKSNGKHHELLIVDEDEGVFLLDMDCPRNYHFLNLVCVRNKAGTGPVYSSSVSVEAPSAKGLMVKVEKKAMES